MRNFGIPSWGRGWAGEYDRAILSGISLALLLIVAGIAFGGGAFASYIDLSSMLLVGGGTVAAALVNFSTAELRAARQAFNEVLLARENGMHERMRYLVDLSQAVKRQGVLVLEREVSGTSDPFLKLALEMTVDGQQPEEVRRILETEMHVSNDRAQRAVQVFETMGSYAPAMGLIGTVIGLVQLLGALDDPSKIGPAMSLALITTLYGAIAANLFLLPIAGRMRNRAHEQSVVKAMTIEGAISLSRQENSIVLEQRLQSFLAAAEG